MRLCRGLTAQGPPPELSAADAGCLSSAPSRAAQGLYLLTPGETEPSPRLSPASGSSDSVLERDALQWDPASWPFLLQQEPWKESLCPCQLAARPGARPGPAQGPPSAHTADGPGTPASFANAASLAWLRTPGMHQADQGPTWGASSILCRGRVSQMLVVEGGERGGDLKGRVFVFPWTDCR